MATPSALNTLIDLAHKESDEAAKRLAATLRASEEAGQKLELLLQYRNDYAARCEADMASGISTTQLHNFQVFMQKLDTAIAGQQKVVDDARQRVAQQGDLRRCSRGEQGLAEQEVAPRTGSAPDQPGPLPLDVAPLEAPLPVRPGHLDRRPEALRGRLRQGRDAELDEGPVMVGHGSLEDVAGPRHPDMDPRLVLLRHVRDRRRLG